MEGVLSGRVIGVTADRRGSDQAVMFSRLGAEVVHGPTIATAKVPDPDLLRKRTDELIAEPPDYLIADTGLGMRTWMDCADDWAVRGALIEALHGVRIASRGPKATGALTSAGLSTWWRSPHEQLDELVTHLVEQGVAGARIAFQLHGDDSAEVVARLEEAGASVTTLPVYVWTRPADVGPAHRLIELCCAAEMDAVTFTAGPQIRYLFELAAEQGQADDLRVALNGPVLTACIGPVCAVAAAENGIRDPLVPDAWRLGSMVRAVADALSVAAATGSQG